MDYYVYIMSNANLSTIYVGVTNNLLRRTHEHRNHIDKGSFTDRYNIEKLVYFEMASDYYHAIEREKQIEGWKKRKLIESKNPEWKDLYPDILEEESP